MEQGKRPSGMDGSEGLTAAQYLIYLRVLHNADVIAVKILTDPDARALAKSIYRLKRFKRLQKTLISK